MVRVRAADIEDLPAMMTVLDGGLLELDVETLREAIDCRDALIAVEGERVLGVLVLVGREIEAVAVRRNRRDQGIGTSLVDAAASRRDHLVAEFDPRVRPFWESLGFEIEPAAEPDRYRGVLDGEPVGAEGESDDEQSPEPGDSDRERAD
jgi:GNAT superfamily N-acetyltransferase